jgi:hypothetical protein
VNSLLDLVERSPLRAAGLVLLWIVAVLLMVLSVPGCTLLQPAAAEVGRAVKHYCAEPAESRLALRQALNAALAPNAIELHCAGDPASGDPGRGVGESAPP